MSEPVVVNVDGHEIKVQFSFASIEIFVDGKSAAKGSKFKAIFGIRAAVGKKTVEVSRSKAGHYYLCIGKNLKNPFTWDHWEMIG